MATTVLCLVRTFPQVERVIDELAAADFSREEISVLIPEQQWAASAIVQSVLARLPGIRASRIHGLGQFIAAGRIMAALGGDLKSTLSTLGVPEVEATLYESGVRRGNNLLAVCSSNPDQRRRALLIFAAAAADDISVAAVDQSEASAER